MKVHRNAAYLVLSFPLLAFGVTPENTPISASIDIHPEDHRAEEVPKPATNQIVTNAELKNDPALAARFLNQAVEDGQWEVIRNILPIYRSSPQHDPILLAYAEGVLARHDGDYEKAIALYRTALSARPELTRMRLDLARMLFENRQYDAARFQFEKARAEHLPDAVLANVQSYLDAIDHADTWGGSIDLSYLNDDNINNASSSKYIDIGESRFVRNANAYPQKGHGLYYNGSLQRDFPLADHHSLRIQEQLTGKSYWDNHDYDDIITRSYLGYSYSNARQRFSLLPFYENRWYGTEPYSSGGGLRTEYSHRLSSNWQSSSALEYQRLHYDNTRYSYLDGHNLLFSTTLGYAFSSRLALYAGVDFGEQHTRYDSETNRLAGGRLGFEAELPFGFSTSLLVGALTRKYVGESDIFSTRRRDLEENYLVSLWHRDLYFWGVMPKLNLSYRKVDSNIDFYSYDQQRVFLSMTRAF
ncbi:porin family protein [Pseudomonas schmalbachii]|uniref:DUF560 domain-containing protein n=1 Tax=Pseudomonas schmalbachii TaxID=2816993 RepID=A0ABS3TRK0_9PSED|nr:porin family protein [Pseudomonas schmalbachii]MBO3275978.1 DUF560 domain-containing protein [Pseudomonas schmalbachii]